MKLKECYKLGEKLKTFEYHELSNIFPLLTDKSDEFISLTEDIKTNGLKIPVIIYQDKILDGRNRYRACIQAGIEPVYETYTGTDARSYVISMNLHRRHLNESQRALIAARLIGDVDKSKINSLVATERWDRKKEDDEIRNDKALSYDQKIRFIDQLNVERSHYGGNVVRHVYIAEAGDKLKIGISSFPEVRIDQLKTGQPDIKLLFSFPGTFEDEKRIQKKLKKYELDNEWFKKCPEILDILNLMRFPDLENASNVDELNSALKIASKVFKVSTGNIYNAKKILKQRPDLVCDIESGKKTINEIKKSISAETRSHERSEKAAAVKVDIEKDLKKNCGVLCADIRTLDPTAFKKIGAVITDPPYPAEYLPLYEKLAELCINVPIVAVMCGQSYLPQIYAMMSKHLTYRWTLAYMTPGHATPIQDRARGLAGSHWKPVLLFGGPGRCLGDDVFTSPQPSDKVNDPWEQSVAGMVDLVERLTEPGTLVCDPFCGGGTTAVACIKTGRRFAGFDIDPKDVETTWQRCLIAADEMKGASK